MPQITGYVTPVERSVFGDYAQSLGLDGAALASLLLHRELRVDRLEKLRTDSRISEVGECPEKITIHRVSDATKERFKKHAATHGLKPSPALALLCRAELREKWLHKAMGRSTRIESKT
jgi:hypothetical protein